MSEIHNILRLYWNHKQFRPLQEDIINSVLQGKDTFALLPTGGGKSICFQVPALAMPGICVVVSPLLALMKDQVENLNKRGITAISINSVMTRNEIEVACDKCQYGKIKFLYVSPERLTNELFLSRLKYFEISMLAIDEAHCISQWGYDFRPAYLKVKELRNYFPEVPIIALTATATPQVAEDIIEKLDFKKDHNRFSKSFVRSNLHYFVRETDNKNEAMLQTIQKVGGTGVIYVRNRARTEQTAAYLANRGFSADFYHAGLNSDDRQLKQENWINNKTQIIVSTNAFGMGIDKPDVRWVIHLDLPESPEAYVQEAGRAGRDEQRAYPILLVEDRDKEDLLNFVTQRFPSIDEIKRVYNALGNFYQIAFEAGMGLAFPFNIQIFARSYDIKSALVFNCIKILEKEGYLEYQDYQERFSKIKIKVSVSELYDFQIRQPVYDTFIKVVLRTYPNVFDQYVAIAETELARNAATHKDQVVAYLKKMDSLGLIEYKIRNDYPVLVYIENRIDTKYLTISPDNLKRLKERALNRANAMIHYAEEKHTCLQTVILNYFGELLSEPCGHCGNCLADKPKQKVDVDLTKQIATYISQNINIVDDLIQALAPASTELIIDTINRMVEDNILGFDNGKLRLK